MALPELPPVPDVTEDDEVLRWDMQPGDCSLLTALRRPGEPSTTSARRARATRRGGAATTCVLRSDRER